MHRLLQDVRFGIRTLLKTPGFTLVAVLVLALGIGANSAMFTIVNGMMFKPLSGRADDLIGLYSHDRTKPDSYRAFSYPNFADIRESAGLFDALMAHTFTQVGIGTADSIRQVFADVVSSNYFDTLDVPLAAGRTFSAAEERPGARIPVAIVSADRADQLGQTIRINGIDFTVVGVTPRGFTGTMALVGPELWLPLGMYDVVVSDMFKENGRGLTDRGNVALVVAGRLKPGVTADAAAARLEAVSRQLADAYPAENRNQLLTINPLPRMSTSTSPGTDQGLGIAAGMLMGLSGVVLLIACLNIANMLLARGSARRKEIAIRLAVGGGRGRIVRQLLTEGLLLAAAGAAGGLLVAYWSTSALVGSLARVMPLPLQFDPSPDVLVLTATTAFAVAATVAFGLGPALKMTRVNLVTDLKEIAADAAPSVLGRRFTARNVLVVGQIALSLMLLAAGGLFARGALKAASATPGFSYDRELLVQIDPELARYDEAMGRAAHRRVLERLRATPGVEAAGIASTVPFGDFHEGEPVERVGGATDRPASAIYRIIGADYFRTLRLPMIRGREFTPAEEDSPNAPRVAIVDERLARRLFGTEDPIGQMIRFAEQPGRARQESREPMQIVGIAAPIRDELFDREAGPAIYVPSGRNYRSNMTVHIAVARPGAEAEMLDVIRRELHALDPALPVPQATTMQGFHDRSLELWAVSAGGRLFMTFGLLALLLAVVGLYGVKSYLVSQRTREIGIRMALGARPRDVLRLLFAEGAALSAVGVAIGLPLAIGLGLLMSNLLYDVKPVDPVVFTAAPLLLVAAAAAATWIPARRATRILPLTALREQ
ncbi:MAG TPA: ABC transporter permease [Vicinamibacterales bacterium]|nr:ABC transporter permease [Vicinamibacterales bacterium]